MPAVALAAGLALGAIATWLALRGRASVLGERADRLEGDLRVRTDQLAQAREELVRAAAALEHEREASAEKLRLLREAKEELANAFKALSAEVRARNAARAVPFVRMDPAKWELSIGF